jgi:hypothetical protein
MEGAERFERLEDHETERAVQDILGVERHMWGGYTLYMLVVNRSDVKRAVA